jgi:hypothetical protein
MDKVHCVVCGETKGEAWCLDCRMIRNRAIKQAKTKIKEEQLNDKLL